MDGYADALFASVYESQWHKKLAPQQYEILLRFVRNEGELSLLDVAAGTGSLALTAARGFRVVANEFGNAMRKAMARRAQRENTPVEILEPGFQWVDLPTRLGVCAFDVVACFGSSLSHCTEAQLRPTLEAFASLSRHHVLLDCKRFSPDGMELAADGKKRATQEDSQIAFRDPLGGPDIHASLRCERQLQADRSLWTIFRCDLPERGEHLATWSFHTWPIDRRALLAAALDCGLALREEIPAGDNLGVIGSARYDYLAFQVT